MDRVERHSTHLVPALRGGGIAIFITFFLIVFFVLPIDRKLLGLFFGALIVLIVNIVDDWGGVKVSPAERLFWEIIGIFVIIGSGIGIDNITNPFGGVIALDAIRYDLSFLGAGHGIMPLSDIFTVIWILLMVNVMNWLDGLDGLASGVSGICALTLFFLSLLPFVNQPNMAMMALILFGAIIGFLPFNFFGGKIKLGDSGATVIGFILAVMAILNQGKIATFFLILGLPILDAFWVILRRIFVDKKSPFKGDKKHFHHRLLQIGFTKKRAVYVIWIYSAIFSLIALLLQGADKKLMAIIIMTVLMVVFSLIVVIFSKNKPNL
jgi:UDP-GlcNAc:undecaprenyl-phosphate GlcNAc-1-phosphate transferase